MTFTIESENKKVIFYGFKRAKLEEFHCQPFARLVRDLDKIFPKEGNRIVSKSQKLSEQSRADQKLLKPIAPCTLTAEGWNKVGEYNQLSNSLDDGLFHPQTQSMRGVSLNQVMLLG